MSIVVEQQPDAPVTPKTELLGWVMQRVDKWREFRDSQHREKWDEYYRIWRGIYSDADKSRKSERSKIITPASMQALDSTVAEIEESVFGREMWFDIVEDIRERADKGQADEMIRARDRLHEKLEEYGIPQEMAKCFLIGAIFGTGIGKIVVDERPKDYGAGTLKEVCVELIALEPYEFIPDPTTDKLDRMLGMAHETIMPLHEVKRLQKDGVFKKVDIGPYAGDKTDLLKGRFTESQMPNEDSVLVCEYHGLVPASKLLKEMPDRKPLDELLTEGEDDILVEAIVTYGNDGVLLRAIKNPFWNNDRSFVAYQHDTVPNYFWGRGVMEKAYHPQKGLDATTRARIDALGLVAHPMVAGDVTRLPRGMNLNVWPGKFWPTTGNPGEVLQPLSLGNVNPALFENAADMERMIQSATGAMDPGAAYNPGQQGGATNTALNASAFIKRARRTMQNIERNFIRPLIHKVYARYAQFGGGQEPWPRDIQFAVKGTLGIMARELEQQQLIQLLALVPQESKPFFAMTKAVFDNSSSPHKADIAAAIDEWMNPEMSEEQQQEMQFQKMLQMRLQEAQVVEVEAKAAKLKAEADKATAEAQKAMAEVQMMDEELEQQAVKNAIDLREVEAFEVQNQLSALMQKLKAFDLAIKAKVANAQVKKLESDANKIQD